MIDPGNVREVDANELLARFILFSKHIRANDGTIKPDALIPHPHRELSVTRHIDATQDEIWEAGAAVARARSRTLYGRADVAAHDFMEKLLVVKPDPILDHPSLPDNPNHANVSGWPDDKGQQRLLAHEIAARASLVRTPTD